MSWRDIKNLWPEPTLQEVPMHFGFGKRKLTIRLPLMARGVPLVDLLLSSDGLGGQCAFTLAADRRGQFIEGLEGERLRRGVQVVGDRLVYIPYLYERYYVDFSRNLRNRDQSLPPWKQQQVLRKERALRATLPDELRFVCYERADQIEGFFRAANALAFGQRGQSFATMPIDPTFREDSQDAAAEGRLICYALCHRETAISYLYCPIVAGSITYQFLGYDRSFAKFSPGLVLLWRVIQHELSRERYLFLDFTKGSGQQKRIFATGKVTCADVFVLRRTLPSLALVASHNVLGRLSYAIECQIQRHRLRTLAPKEGTL